MAFYQMSTVIKLAIVRKSYNTYFTDRGRIVRKEWKCKVLSPFLESSLTVSLNIKKIHQDFDPDISFIGIHHMETKTLINTKNKRGFTQVCLLCN